MKSKARKCFKWILFTVFTLVVLGCFIGHLGDHRRFHEVGERGSWAIQGANLHHHLQHGQFHLIGIIVLILLWGIIIALVLKFIRRRKAKHRVSPPIVDITLASGWSQLTSPNADFLDQWERNLKNLQEGEKNGDL